jgi:hypothetical protein
VLDLRTQVGGPVSRGEIGGGSLGRACHEGDDSGNTCSVHDERLRLAKGRIGETMKPTNRPSDEAASAKITKRIEDLGDWRGETLAHVRRLIHDAHPDIQEEWKWEKATSPGTPVWSHDGIVCTGESHKQVVKLTFARGAFVEDPEKLFNSSLEGNMRRAIDLREGETIDEDAFRRLIRAAVAANAAVLAERAAKKK